MHFDDRLDTLLAAPIDDPRDRAVRWRQLVDLLARFEDMQGTSARAALDIVRRDAFLISEDVRAATVRSIAGRPIPRDLLRILAEQPLRIAAPLFAAMTLDRGDADDLLVNADPDIRGLVTVVENVNWETVPRERPATAGGTAPDRPSISAMVDRIKQFQERAPGKSASAMPAQPIPPQPTAPQPLGATRREARLFEWESDASGHIGWVEGAPRGALVGRPLGGEGGALLEDAALTRLARHHPFVDVPVALSGVVGGTWSATGVPAFDPATGRFLGYRGVARRSDPETGHSDEQREPDLDALREMVHEIKTPLNAIIGFAEIIDGQYLGPAHRRYRERAASIVGQARQLLDAVEDLDFAAKLRAARDRPREHEAAAKVRMADLLDGIAPDLDHYLAASGGILERDIGDVRDRLAASPDIAERLMRRLLLPIAKLVAHGEAFRVAISRRGPMCRLTIARPRLIEGFDEAQLVDPAFDPSGGDEEQSIGLGFALRLVRGLARVAGGGLIIDDHYVTLELPARES